MNDTSAIGTILIWIIGGIVLLIVLFAVIRNVLSIKTRVDNQEKQIFLLTKIAEKLGANTEPLIEE